MQRIGLAQQILDYMKSLTNAEYMGLLTIDQDDTIYTFTVGLPSYMAPTTISGSFESDSSFLEYLKTEIKKKRLYAPNYYKVVRIEGDHIPRNITAHNKIRDLQGTTSSRFPYIFPILLT